MTTRQQKSQGDKLVALPSLSCSLSSLPQATSMSNVSLHESMYAQRAAEGQAKLQKVLSTTAASPQTPGFMSTYPNPAGWDSTAPNSSSPPLMMRKPERPKFQV